MASCSPSVLLRQRTNSGDIPNWVSKQMAVRTRFTGCGDGDMLPVFIESTIYGRTYVTYGRFSVAAYIFLMFFVLSGCVYCVYGSFWQVLSDQSRSLRTPSFGGSIAIRFGMGCFVVSDVPPWISQHKNVTKYLIIHFYTCIIHVISCVNMHILW